MIQITNKVKRIALVNPFQTTSKGYDLNVVQSKGQLTEIPLGLSYISAYIQQFGYQVKIFDAHLMAVKGFSNKSFSELNEVKHELITNIIDFDPDVVGISCLFHYIYKSAHEIAAMIKRRNLNIIIVMGGAYPTVSTEFVLSDRNIDFVILGEGEKTFLDLLEALNSRFIFRQLTSIAYKNNQGQIIINRTPNILSSLDEIAMPDRKDFVLEDYYHYGRHFIQRFEEYEGKELKIATLTATRGCVFDCTFCISKKLWGGGLRVRSPENVLNEIVYLNKEFGINYFAFNDDNVIINKSFAKSLLKGIIKKRLNIKWTTGGISVRGLDEEIVDLMIQSGCLIFNIAIESASSKILKNINKPVTIDEVIQTVEIIKKYKNTYIMALFMLGFPYETEEDFWKTIEFGKLLKCDWTLYSCLTPFPGSEVYNEVIENNMLPVNIDFERLDFRDYLIKPAYMSRTFVKNESYFANLDQNFFNNPNLFNEKSQIAMSDFKNVIKLCPTHASAYYCIGKILENQNRISEAEKYYIKAKKYLSGLHYEYFKRNNLI